MSTTIKPKQGVVYECYKGYIDSGLDRVRIGQKFVWDGDDYSSQYVFDKASGRGISVLVPKDKFAAHFCPAAEQPKQSYTELKIGDKVMISDDSIYYRDGDYANPINTVGTIVKFQSGDLGIVVKWDDETSNSYNACDLVLAKQESYIHGVKDSNQSKIKNMTLQAITVSSTEQIKELAKVSFLKDQIEAAFPHLFITHKVGNRYKHEDGNRYILTGENSHVALTNLKTGMIESRTVHIDSFDNITADEFKQLCLDTDKLTLIKERQ